MAIITNNIQRGTIVANKKGCKRIYKGSTCVFQKADSTPQTTLLNGLISLWEMDETSGTTVVDECGICDGINDRVSINNYGVINKSYLFSGNTNNGNPHVQISNPSALFFNPIYDSYTVSLWFWASQVSSYAERIISSYSEVSRGYPFVFYKLNTGFIRFMVYNGSISTIITSTHSYVNSSWHHLLMTCDTSTLKAYIDNVLHGQSSLFANFTPPTAKRICIGAEALYDNHSSGFKGLIDQTAIWNRALTQQEISDLYNSGNGRAYSEF